MKNNQQNRLNYHIEVNCADDSIDKGELADFICAAIDKKYKKVESVVVRNGFNYDDSDKSKKIAKRKKR